MECDDAHVGLRTVCPRTEAAFALLARKWTGLILLSLREKELHFAELRSSIPELSSRVLALRTRELEAAELLEREVRGASPVRVSYRLTDKGRALANIMESIAEWARTY